MKFKVDENLPREVIQILVAAGHDSVSALDQDLGGEPDEVLLRICAAEGRAIVTEDLDFADLRRFPPNEHAGIVVFRLRRPGLNAAVEATELLLRQINVDELPGKLIIVESGRFRLREA